MKQFIYSIFIALSVRNFFNWMPDKLYIQIQWYFLMSYKLNLNHPTTFSEKLNWLKLNNRKDLYTQLVDKYAVREYVASKIGDKHLIPLLGKWGHFDDIDFNRLPDRFVLKCNHCSRDAMIYKNKSTFNFDYVKKKYDQWLKRNFYYEMREWPYKNIHPCIIAEEYIQTGTEDLMDYKWYCFNGTAKYCKVISNKSIDSAIDFYTLEWEHLPIQYVVGSKIYPNNQHLIQKPTLFKEMIRIAEKLSEGIPFARIDLYHVQDKIYFGEITLFPTAGYCDFSPKETNKMFGNLIKLNENL